PDYAYLFNGLNLVNGVRPEHVDHPGTPVQLFAAGGIELANLGTEKDVINEHVLAHAESYLKALNSGLVVAYSILLLLAGLLVWQKTGSVIAALLLQATPFLLADSFVE